MRGYYRHTKIIATLGPATESRERLEQLIRAGVDVIRLNMAHATGEWITTVVARIREVSVELSRHIAIMMDVKGPEIRTGVVAEPIELKVGELFEFYTEGPVRRRARGQRQLSQPPRRRESGRDRAGR